MSIKRVNSTGRCKIVREDVRFTLRSDSSGSLTFDAALNLADYDFPSDALVFVEAYRQTTFMRFPFGTVAAPRLPPGVTGRLTEFTTGERLLFRVKVTSANDRSGLLLAEADRISACNDEEQPDKRVALLPTEPANLGQLLWKVDIDEGLGTTLQINKDVGDWEAFARSPLCRSLIFPAAMREVLWHVVAVRKTDHIDDQGDWGSRWLGFAQSLPGVAEMPERQDDVDPKDWLPWIDSAVESFARQHRMLEHYQALTVGDRSV